jgi:phenylpropionate dioxygenase-like ring-hydroxylating dioxygenase large terminal subunit
LDGLPGLVPEAYRLIDTAEGEVPANWKIFTEGFLEGYHIRSTHPQTFYPLQYDNLNVVETCGPHRRIAFPYRAIEKLRTRPADARSADGVLTYVTHLFPTALVATFPGRILMVVLEPLAIDRTWQVAFTLSNEPPDDDRAQAYLTRGTTLVDAGAAEDREMAMAIQRSLASEANEFLEFGRFEGAIVHFHRTLAAAIGERR